MGSRQPIAVSKKLERINQSEEEGSGRSYSNTKMVDGRENNVSDEVYIYVHCIGILKEFKYGPDYIKHGIKTIDPKHGKKKVIETILKRQGVNWKRAEDFDNVDYIITDIGKSKRLHPEGYGLPCCCNSNKTMKKIVDKGTENSEEREKKLKILEKATIKKGIVYQHKHPLKKMNIHIYIQH